uniref:Uncharacterized protein n=1 Tax=Lactuca sativa TaxID=4236 RepID=A0A9R1UZX9_LACSA|nr:hypothetical protein LSAT_V11C700383670 [Lactuca sativa]
MYSSETYDSICALLGHRLSGFLRQYPWGRVIWDFTYRQLRTVFEKIEENLNANAPRVGSRHKYTLQGFVYAFKIWIIKTFPNNSIVGSPI